MIKIVLFAAGLALEISSISIVLRNASSELAWLMFLMQHATASVLLTAFTWHSMPVKFRYPRAQVLLLLFNFSFFMPFLGLLGVLLAALLSGYRRRVVTSQPFGVYQRQALFGLSKSVWANYCYRPLFGDASGRPSCSLISKYGRERWLLAGA